jgi:hypothetical protein
MTDLQRVLQWFDQGRLIRPRSGRPAHSLDLMGAIASVCGVEQQELSARARKIAQHIGPHEHVVFVLIDGLGAAFLETHADSAPFLSSNVTQELQAIFPSTTAAALTSLATAAFPSQHGILSWWIYLEELDVIAEILPFVERFSRKGLLELGARSEAILVTPSILPRFKHAPLVVTLSRIANSVYSRYWAGNCPNAGYEKIPQGVDLALAHALSKEPTYTYFYLPQFDEVCHKQGLDTPEPPNLLAIIDREIERLHRALAGRARLVVSSDHGHVNRQTGRFIKHDDPIMRCLKCPPSGEPTVPMFHVRPGCEAAFRGEFTAAFGDLFALLSADEVESLELLGPGKLSDSARRHCGDFVGIAPEAHTIHYLHPTVKPIIHRGVHSGLSPAEMTVPLILL